MNETPQALTLQEKLVLIQSELKAPKNQKNNFGNYMYRSCEDILEAVKPLLLKYSCSLILSDEVVNIATRFYIKAIVVFWDKSTEVHGRITAFAFAREEEVKKGMDGAQITGAASSYARKYALNGLFLIDDNKDSDPTNKGKEKTVKSPQISKPEGSKPPQISKEVLGAYKASIEGSRSVYELNNLKIKFNKGLSNGLITETMYDSLMDLVDAKIETLQK